MRNCNFWFLILFIAVLSWFDYLFLATYEKREVYNYLAKIKILEDSERELKRQIKKYKLKKQ